MTVTEWAATIAADLEPFADGAVSTTVSGSQIVAQWAVYDTEKIATFQIDGENEPKWQSPDGSLQSYRAFLTSKDAGNLSRIAAAIVQRYARLPDSYTPIAAKGLRLNVADDSVADASEVVESYLAPHCHGASVTTDVIFIKGEAGAGKTTFWTDLTRQTAERFLAGECSFILFYVSAQSRSLASLNEILASEIQDLRARHLLYKSIPILARYGLLFPVIDAFDELLGAAGYGDAFGSLQQFLEDLAGQGALIVSARSAFYETEFRSRYRSGTSAYYEVMPIELLRWDNEQIKQFLSENEPSGRTWAFFQALPPIEQDILRKPFFCSKFIDYCMVQVDGVRLTSSGLIDYLMKAYVKREASKLADRDGKPLLTFLQQSAFLTECALYMWQNDKRRLERKDIEFLADYRAVEEGFSPDQAQQFVAKAITNAGLAATSGTFGFEHDIYFDYFLARKLESLVDPNAISLAGQTSFGAFLQQGQFTADFARFIIMSEHHAKGVVRKLNVAPEGDIHLFGDNVKHNRGVLLSVVLTLWPSLCVGQQFRQCDVVGIEIGNHFASTELRDIRFSSVRFINSDITCCELKDLRFSLCHFDRLKLTSCSMSNVLGIVPGANLYSLIIDRKFEYWQPDDMKSALETIGWKDATAPITRSVLSHRADQVLVLLRRFAAGVRLQNTLVLDVTNKRFSGYLRDQAWDDFQKLLIGSQLASLEPMEASGPRKMRLRLDVPANVILAARDENDANPNLRQFWQHLETL